jgi:hypothetical protein
MLLSKAGKLKKVALTLGGKCIALTTILNADVESFALLVFGALLEILLTMPSRFVE